MSEITKRTCPIRMEEIDKMIIDIAIAIEKYDLGFIEDKKGDELMDEIGLLLEKYYGYPLHKNYN